MFLLLLALAASFRLATIANVEEMLKEKEKGYVTREDVEEMLKGFLPFPTPSSSPSPSSTPVPVSFSLHFADLGKEEEFLLSGEKEADEEGSLYMSFGEMVNLFSSLGDDYKDYKEAGSLVCASDRAGFCKISIEDNSGNVVKAGRAPFTYRHINYQLADSDSYGICISCSGSDADLLVDAFIGSFADSTRVYKYSNRLNNNCNGVCEDKSVLSAEGKEHIIPLETTKKEDAVCWVGYFKKIDWKVFDILNTAYMFCGCGGLDLSNFNTSKVTDMNNMFCSCKTSSLDLSSFDTSKVTDMNNMFSLCDGLTTLDISSFDTSNVVNMSRMFVSCYGLKKLDVSKFNTSKVTDMQFMFAGCEKFEEIDVSNFDTSNVVNMYSMFMKCYYLENLNLSSFNISKVTNVGRMFADCSSMQMLDISNFDFSVNRGEQYMLFQNCDYLNTTYVNSLAYEKISGCLPQKAYHLWVLTDEAASKYELLRVPISFSLHFVDLGEEEAITMRAESDPDEEGDVYVSFAELVGEMRKRGNKYDEYNADNMLCSSSKAGSCRVSTKEKSIVVLKRIDSDDYGFVYGNVSYQLAKGNHQYSVCMSCANDDVDIYIDKFVDSFATSSNVYTYNKKVDNNCNSGDMCSEKSILAGREYAIPLETTTFNDALCWVDQYKKIDWKVFDILNTAYMFSLCKELAELDLTGMNTSKVTSMNAMFGWSEKLTSLDVSMLDTSEVTNMYCMFSGSQITSLDLSNFNTSKVTNMNGMFYECGGLGTLDLSNFDTSKVTTMEEMFYKCEKLTDVNLSSFDISSVETMRQMFSYCKSLKSLNLSSFYKFSDSNTINPMPRMFSFTNIETLDVRNLDLSNTNVNLGIRPFFGNGQCLTTIYAKNSETLFKLFPYLEFGTAEGTPNYGDHSFVLVDKETGKHVYTQVPITKFAIIDKDNNTREVDYGLYLGEEKDAKYISFSRVIETIERYPDLVFTEDSMLCSSDIPGKAYIADGVVLVKYIDNTNNNIAFTSSNIAYKLDTAREDKLYEMQFDMSAEGEALAIAHFFKNLATSDNAYAFDGVPRVGEMPNEPKSIVPAGKLHIIPLKLASPAHSLAWVAEVKSVDWSLFDAYSTAYMFDGCSAINSLNLSSLDTSKVSDMRNMLRNTANLNTLDITGFVLKDGVNTDGMFDSCGGATLQLYADEATLEKLNGKIGSKPCAPHDSGDYYICKESGE